MTVLRQWTGNHNRAVLTLHDSGLLVKSEKSVDRLHVLGDRGHAIDCSMVGEALSLGAKVLEIREDSGAFVWRAELSPLLERSRTMMLAGVKRWAFLLENFDLVRGVAPQWYQEAQGRKRYAAEHRKPECVQMSLFDDSMYQRLRCEL